MGSTFGSESLGTAHGSFPPHSWQKGLEFSSCGQWEEAIICYTKAIGLDPQRVVGPRGLGTCRGRGGSVVKAGCNTSNTSNTSIWFQDVLTVALASHQADPGELEYCWVAGSKG